MITDRKFLVEFIQSTLPIPNSIAISIASNFQPVSFARNAFLLKEGQVCKSYIFLESGLIRAYTLNSSSDEVTTNFYGKNSTVFEVASYFKRTPTKETFHALTDCRGWQGDYDSFQVLFHTLPEFREFGRAILVNGFITLKERTLNMINFSAEQRYAQLMESNPEIFRYAPLKYIASYLGVTDTSLSRIRREMSKK
jgi:CRP-like cAMP-binding protein